MTKAGRDLIREMRPFGIMVEPTRGDHLALIMPNGRKVFTSSTPSDWRALRNVRATVRRKLKEGYAT